MKLRNKKLKKKEKDNNKLLEEFIMEKEKYVFNKEEFREGFNDYISDHNYFDPYTIWEIVNEDLKKNGMESRYIHCATPLRECDGESDFIKLNDSLYDAEDCSEIKAFNNYIDDEHGLEMKDPEFAKSVYGYVKENYKDDYNFFVYHRSFCGDAYVETQEEERER